MPRSPAIPSIPFSLAVVPVGTGSVGTGSRQRDSLLRCSGVWGTRLRLRLYRVGLQGAPPETGSGGAEQHPEEPGATAAGAPRRCSGLPPSWVRERAGPDEVTEPMAPAALLCDREREVVSSAAEHPNEGPAGDGSACGRAPRLCRPSLGPAHVTVPLGHCPWPLTSGRSSGTILGPPWGQERGEAGAPSPGTHIPVFTPSPPGQEGSVKSWGTL